MPHSNAMDQEKKEALRRLLTDGDLPFPDEILQREDGEVVVLWHDAKRSRHVDLVGALARGLTGGGSW